MDLQSVEIFGKEHPKYQNLLSWSQRVTKKENELGKQLNDFTKNDFAILFSENKWSSYTSFYKVHSFLYDYLKWLSATDNIIIPSIEALSTLSFADVNSSYRMAELYFKDEEDFINALNYVIPGPAMARARAIEILIWLGYGINEIPTLKTSMLDKGNLSFNGKKISQALFEQLEFCSNLSSYKFSMANDKSRDIGNRVVEFELCESEYLVKASTRYPTETGAISPRGIKRIISLTNIYFNNEEVAKKYYGKQFKGTCLAINTIFIEWHQYEEENHIDITKLKRKELKKIFPQYEKRITLNSVSNYKAWRNCYYGMSDNE